MKCEKCRLTLCFTQDSDPDGDIVNFKVHCPCGYANNLSFLGYPKLWGTPDMYFDFTDEFEITCKNR